MRHPQYDRICFKSAKTLGALHSTNVEFLGLYPIHKPPQKTPDDVVLMLLGEQSVGSYMSVNVVP